MQQPKQVVMKRSKVVSYRCTFGLCRQRYSAEEKLLEHINTHTTAGRHKCILCSYTTDDGFNMKKHMSIHTGEYNYVCTYPSCNYRSNNSSSLVVHTRMHTKERPYVCSYEGCHYKTITNGHLRRHVKRNHNKSLVVDKMNCTVNEMNRAAAMLASLWDNNE